MIELTPAAIARIRRFLNKRGHGIGVHIDVIRSGCAGYSYQLDFVDEVGAEQEQIAGNSDDFALVIDCADRAQVDGLLIDVKRKGLNESFTFTNRNARKQCSCGQSFRI